MKCETAYLQIESELYAFIALLQKENVKSYLEIGCKFGGSLWHIAKALPQGSRVVALDLPHGDNSFKVTLPPLQECLGALGQRGYDTHLIIGDSTKPDIIEKVLALGPFDACFIDANHTLPYVTKDWETYSKVCRLVAFHDINHTKAIAPGKMPIDVPQLWKTIKAAHRHLEIKHDREHNGIGVVWMS